MSKGFFGRLAGGGSSSGGIVDVARNFGNLVHKH